MRTALWGSLLALFVLFSSCNSKKYLEDDQSFLMSNKIKLKSNYPIHSKSEIKDSFLKYYRQPQTKYSLGFPRHVFYYQYQEKIKAKPNHKKWDEERLIKNRPVIYDSLKAEQTSDDFEKYLQLRGYRSAIVNFEAKTEKKVTKVRYHINPGPRLYLDTILIIAEDSIIQEIVDKTKENSLIPAESPLDIQLYNQEKARIVRLLQNEGYATFNETYVSPMEVDTSRNRVKGIIRLLNPSDSTLHQIYVVGDIKVYPDYNIVDPKHYHDTMVNYITYFLPDSGVFTLKPEAIQRNIFLYPNANTRKDNIDQTMKKLGRIELIRFVNPDAVIDSSGAGAPAIDYTFYLTRNKKINFDVNGELTYSNIASQERRSLFGTSFSTNYRDRNIFRNAEILNLNAELGFEFNFFNRESTINRRLLNSLNAGLTTDLSFQRFMDPLNIYHMIGHTDDPEKQAKIGGRLHRWLIDDASTRLSLGFNYVIITDLYDYYNINANLSYDIQPDPFKKLTITRIGFDLFVPNAFPDYQKILDSNKFLAESFGKQLYTGLLFRNYIYDVNSKVKSKTGHFRMLHSMELSGIEMYAINSAVNLISGEFKEIVLNPNGNEDDIVEFSQFAKGEIDVRYFRSLTRNTELAIKLNTGVATPFGPYTKQVPYPKQFYVGGAQSNRAWQIRQLGPGGHEDKTAIPANVPFYQTGDFKIDFSAELRFPLFWYFKGVLFVDAANVWILQEDDSRTEANLSHNFYKEFGIGYGYGIRLDLDFFIIRLDLGYKLHNPYPVIYDADKKPSRWLVNEIKKFPSGAEPQIAVGLPF